MSSLKAQMVAKARGGTRKRHAIVVATQGQYISLPFSLSGDARLRMRFHIQSHLQAQTNAIFASGNPSNLNAAQFGMRTFLNSLYFMYGSQNASFPAIDFVQKWIELDMTNVVAANGEEIHAFPQNPFAPPTDKSTLFSYYSSNFALPGAKCEYLRIDDGGNHADLVAVPQGSTEFSATPARENGFWCGAKKLYYYAEGGFGPFGIEDIPG